MCGRFTQSFDREALEARYGLGAGGVELRPRWNLAPGQEAVVVVGAGEPGLELMRWGLVPSWAQDASQGSKAINARAESVADKPSFRGPLRRRRCLVPADGFYEWAAGGKGRAKQPWLFGVGTEGEGGIFSLAGLWDLWQGPEGEELRSFTIITTQANDLVGRVHQRMPVILSLQGEAAWLEPGLVDPRSWLGSFPAQAMWARPVSPLVNSVSQEGPRLVEPVETQGGLFPDIP